jgi:hypothetical protein
MNKQERGCVAIVQEYCAGGNLYQVAQEHYGGRVPEWAVVSALIIHAHAHCNY